MYYVGSYGMLYFFSIALLWLLVNVVKITPYAAGVVGLPINAAVAFVLLRTIVFR